MFQDRLQGNPTMNTNGNPPVSFAPTLYYGNLDTYAASGGAIGPSGINNLMGYNNPATTVNWSFGIQQQLKNFAIDAAYVGSAAYHLIAGKDINPIPLGAHFNPAFEDPSQKGKPLADNFLRPYYGWGSITTLSSGYNSNYHSLQVSVQRRFTDGLQVGIAYTFSKALDVADGDTSTVSPYFDPRFRNYGRAGFDRPQVFVANYVYSLPKLGTKMNSFSAWSWITGNCAVSLRFISGSPFIPGSAGRLRRIRRVLPKAPASTSWVPARARHAYLLQVVQYRHGGGAGDRQVGRSQRHHGQLRQRRREHLHRPRHQQLGPFHLQALPAV